MLIVDGDRPRHFGHFRFHHFGDFAVRLRIFRDGLLRFYFLLHLTFEVFVFLDGGDDLFDHAFVVGVNVFVVRIASIDASTSDESSLRSVHLVGGDLFEGLDGRGQRRFSVIFRIEFRFVACFHQAFVEQRLIGDGG